MVTEKHYDAGQGKRGMKVFRAIKDHIGLGSGHQNAEEDMEERDTEPQQEGVEREDPPKKSGATNKALSEVQRAICIRALAPDGKMPSLTKKLLDDAKASSSEFASVYAKLLKQRNNNPKKTHNSIYKSLNSYFKTLARRTANTNGN
jgi:hypothetical protein